MAFREGGAQADCGCCLPRRGFLAALAGGAALAGAGPGFAAKPPAPKRDIVDVHAHYLPAELRGPAAGPMGGWTLDRHLAEMDAAGVTRSLLSITTPGVIAAPDALWPLIRKANEAGAKMVSDHAARLGLFLYVNPLNVDATLKEIAYGLDTLKANGVGVFTNYGGVLIGDPVFDPIWAELNRRKAVVYVHPAGNVCCGRTTPMTPGLPDTIIEYGTDTTRAIARYVYGGAARKFPDVTMIWSHSAGSMPYLIERFDFADRNAQGAMKAAAPNGFRAEIAKFYYDVAQASNPVSTRALRSVVPMQQILFGTDYPFRTMTEHVDQLEAGKVFSPAELKALYRQNLVRGLPGLMT